MSEPKVGAVVAGKYRIERVLGRGGMGFVVAATHLQLDEPVAVKFLHALLARDPELVLRFQREAKAARKIRSEHVVRILDVGEEDGAPYMVMEHLEGSDLDTLLQKGGPQPIPLAIDYLLQAMEALAEAHVQGMVHRDLKPANLFLAKRADGSPLVKVLDFGISKIATGTGELALTKTDAKPMGTPLYMAPEQMRQRGTVDARTDIWALGVILYELLSGKPPFDGASMTDLCAAILQDPSPPIRVRRGDVPVALEHAIWRCLEKDPAARYPDVAALAVALLPFASPAGRTSVERIAGVLRTTQVPPQQQQQIVISAPPPRMAATTAPKNWAATAGAEGASPKPDTTKRLLLAIGALISVLIATIVVVAVVVVERMPTTKTIRITSKPQKDGGTVDEDEEEETKEAPKKHEEKKPAADPVSFVPISGNYGQPFDVTLRTRTPGATIHYTTDGTDPVLASPVYSKPIRVEKTTVVKAIAIAPGTSKSFLKFQSYLLMPNEIDAPVAVDLGEVACGSTPKPHTFTIKTTGPATKFQVEMRDANESPFLVSADGELPAHGEATIRITPKLVPMQSESLDGVADTIIVTSGVGHTRHVTVTELATGPAFAVSDDSPIDVGDVRVGKTSPPETVTIRSVGTTDAIVKLAITGDGFEIAPDTLVIPPRETRTAQVTLRPSGTAPYRGNLQVSHATAHPGCTLPVSIPLKGIASGR